MVEADRPDCDLGLITDATLLRETTRLYRESYVHDLIAVVADCRVFYAEKHQVVLSQNIVFAGHGFLSLIQLKGATRDEGYDCQNLFLDELSKEDRELARVLDFFKIKENDSGHLFVLVADKASWEEFSGIELNFKDYSLVYRGSLEIQFVVV